MENLTVTGMKELNQKLSRIDRSLEDIAKSLSTLVKIANRQFPQVRMVSSTRIDPKDVYTPDVVPFPNEEEEDDEMP